jgi:hypothetical protein
MISFDGGGNANISGEVFVKQPEAKGKLVSKLLKKTFSF